MRRQAVVLSLLALVAGLLGGCKPGHGAPQVWIDSPLNGSTLPLLPVQVQSHVGGLAGAVDVELWVNDAVVDKSSASMAPNGLLFTQQLWNPAGPGAYTLKVLARGSGSAWGQALATVMIASQATATPTVAATVGGTSTPTATGVPTATPTPVAMATEVPTATPTATAIPTATPTPTATFVATATPTSTPVPTAIPTVPAPTIGRHSVSAGQFFYGDSGCGPKEVTIGVSTTDASSCKIYYHLVNKATGGETRWASRDMTAVRGGWTCTINSGEIAGYDPAQNVSYWFQFYFVVANSGGQTQSHPSSTEVTLSRCTLVR